MSLKELQELITSLRSNATSEELAQLKEMLQLEIESMENAVIKVCGRGNIAMSRGTHASQKKTANKVSGGSPFEQVAKGLGIKATDAADAQQQVSRVATLMNAGLSQKEAVARAAKGPLTDKDRAGLKTKVMMSDAQFDRLNPDMSAIRQELAGTGITANSNKELFTRYGRYNEVLDNSGKATAIAEAKALKVYEKGKEPKKVTVEDLLDKYAKAS